MDPTLILLEFLYAIIMMNKNTCTLHPNSPNINPNQTWHGLLHQIFNLGVLLIDFTYVYEYFFLKDFDITFPLSNFDAQILTMMNVALTQLHLNNWAFLKAFQILYGFLLIEPTIKYVHVFFYELKHEAEITWVLLRLRSLRARVNHVATIAPGNNSLWHVNIVKTFFFSASVPSHK